MTSRTWTWREPLLRGLKFGLVGALLGSAFGVSGVLFQRRRVSALKQRLGIENDELIENADVVQCLHSFQTAAPSIDVYRSLVSALCQLVNLSCRARNGGGGVGGQEVRRSDFQTSAELQITIDRIVDQFDQHRVGNEALATLKQFVGDTRTNINRDLHVYFAKNQ